MLNKSKAETMYLESLEKQAKMPYSNPETNIKIQNSK